MKAVIIGALLMIQISLIGCISYKTFSGSETFMVYDDLQGKQEELYVKANEWMVNTFNDAESVIQFTDKESGTIIGKYLLGGQMVTASTYVAAADLRVYAIIDVRVKDNKARISVNPQEWRTYDPNFHPKYALTPEKVQMESEKLMNEFYEHMKRNVVDF